jgi:hypothetical protein
MRIIKPRETRVIDLRKLRDAQKPDFRENTIPPDATDGSVHWIRFDGPDRRRKETRLYRRAPLTTAYHSAFLFFLRVNAARRPFSAR